MRSLWQGRRRDPIWELWWGYASAVLAPQMRITRPVLTAVALAVALTSAGCGGSSGPSTHGPLRGGAFGYVTGGGDCAVVRVGQPVSFGDEQFTNHGHTTLVLDRVGLRHPRNVRLIGSIAVPGTYGIGVVDGFPPRYRELPPTWKHRQPVHGFRLAPGKSFQIVLGVVATGGRPARSPGMAIYYHDPAGRYVAVDHFAMEIAQGRCRG
jgi:hypothetical protein